MLKTGAFEVQVRSLDGPPSESATVWSGIAHGGRPPATVQEMQEILTALQEAVDEGRAAAGELEGGGRPAEAITLEEEPL